MSDRNSHMSILEDKEFQVFVSSSGMYRLPYLGQFLGQVKVRRRPPFSLFPSRGCFCAGWGLKEEALRLKNNACRRNIPFIHVEDGFYRSIALGVKRSNPLSLVLDDLGIYYDATRPSRLERMLNGDFGALPDLPAFARLKKVVEKSGGDPLDDPELLKRARDCIDYIVHNRLSKYNNARDIKLRDIGSPRVLIVDQTKGDLSVRHGMADGDRFELMLNEALLHHPDAEIIVKIHPDVLAGSKQGHLLNSAYNERIRVLTVEVNSISLIQQVDYVYVVSSQMGFESLLLGKPVRCFGVPFYAGWGLTEDLIPSSARKKERSVEQLFAAACLLYSRYIDPQTGEPCELESVLKHLAAHRNRSKVDWGRASGN